MSKSQRIMLFRLLTSAAKAKDVKMTDDLRADWTAEILGNPKSWAKLNNGDVSKLKAAFEVMIDDTNLPAVMKVNDPRIEEKKRLIYSIETYGPECEECPHAKGIFSWAYIEEISNRKFHTMHWRDLDADFLLQLKITIQRNATYRRTA